MLPAGYSGCWNISLPSLSADTGEWWDIIWHLRHGHRSPCSVIDWHQHWCPWTHCSINTIDHSGVCQDSHLAPRQPFACFCQDLCCLGLGRHGGALNSFPGLVVPCYLLFLLVSGLSWGCRPLSGIKERDETLCSCSRYISGCRAIRACSILLCSSWFCHLVHSNYLRSVKMTKNKCEEIPAFRTIYRGQYANEWWEGWKGLGLAYASRASVSK